MAHSVLITLLLAASCACIAFGTVVTYKDLVSTNKNDYTNPISGTDSVPDYQLFLYSSTKFPLATCLDGTQGGYYLRPALNPGAATKYRIFFEGGGWCVSNEDCFARSKTALGTTVGLPPTSPEPSGYCGSSFLSSNPSVTEFYDYVSIYVPYCDGTSFTGSVLAPVPVNATASVTYRGAWQRDALISSLVSDHGLSSATDVHIGGCSAGGLTIYLNLDYLTGLVRRASPQATVHGLADAGFFLDHSDASGKPFRTPLFQWGYYAWNSSAALSPACLASYPPATQWKCIFAQYAAPFIRTPLFNLNSKYDSCQLNGCELQLPDVNSGWAKMSPSSQAASQAYSGDFMSVLNVSGMPTSPVHGGFITACLVHCNAGDAAWWTTKAPPAGKSGPAITMGAAFAAWVANPAAGAWWIDNSATPAGTATCA